MLDIYFVFFYGVGRILETTRQRRLTTLEFEVVLLCSEIFCRKTGKKQGYQYRVSKTRPLDSTHRVFSFSSFQNPRTKRL